MMCRFAAFLCLLSAVLVRGAWAQPAFAVASIRPSAAEVKFERDGRTTTTPGHLSMRDVTVSTGIKWSYGVQQSQISGPAWIQSDHFDIDAKADEPATDAQMKLMLQALLADRFKLTFHRENREVRGYAMTVGKGGTKLHPAVGDGVMQRENSANGTVARNITLQEFADFIAGPLEAPVVNKTGLEGKYDLTLDFTSYLPPEERAMKPDFLNIVMAALQGELGLKLESQKVTVAVMVVDRVEKPSEN